MVDLMYKLKKDALNVGIIYCYDFFEILEKYKYKYINISILCYTAI